MKNKKASLGGLVGLVLVVILIISIVMWAIEYPQKASVVFKEILEIYVKLLVRVGKAIANLIATFIREASRPEYATNVSIINNTMVVT